MAHDNINVFSVDNFEEVFTNEKEINKKDHIYRKAILLETWLSKKIPNFDFNQMKNDPVILEF